VKNELENLRVVLVATRNPLNLGAVARAMSNFGAMELRVVQPYEKAWREAKSAVGAAEVIARAKEFASVAEAVADCTLVVGTTAVGNRDLKQPLRSVAEAGPLIRARLRRSRVALLFGSEKWGLSNESLSQCHWLLRIPTREEHRSMNLGQSAAVCLYELVRAGGSERRKLRGESGKEVAKMETVERIGSALLEVLQKSGYVGARKKELSEVKLRRMLRRLAMSETDAEVLLGMVRKILWKLEEK
jgi:TrmH family RNA methyltransferase